jgi:hypothetical protein
VVSCTFTGTTVVGAVRTLAVNAYSNTAGTSSIQASTTSPTTDPVPGNNAASVSVTVGAPGLPIPILDRYGLILLGLMFAGLSLLALRRAD